MLKAIINKGAMAAVLCAGLLAACITSGVREESAMLVARKDFKANREWQMPKVMGRDFWNMLNIPPWACSSNGLDNGSNADEFCFKKLKDKPVYKESGREYNVNIFNKDSN